MHCADYCMSSSSLHCTNMTLWCNVGAYSLVGCCQTVFAWKLQLVGSEEKGDVELEQIYGICLIFVETVHIG